MGGLRFFEGGLLIMKALRIPGISLGNGWSWEQGFWRNAQLLSGRFFGFFRSDRKIRYVLRGYHDYKIIKKYNFVFLSKSS